MSIQRIATKEGHRSFSKTDKCLESKSLFQFPSELAACFEVQQRRQVHTGAIQNYLSIGSSILEDGWKLLSRIVYNTHIFPYHHLLISSLIIVSKLPQQLSRCLPKKLRIQCCCWPRKQQYGKNGRSVLGEVIHPQQPKISLLEGFGSPLTRWQFFEIALVQSFCLGTCWLHVGLSSHSNSHIQHIHRRNIM